MQVIRIFTVLVIVGLTSACSKSPIEHFEQSNAGKALEDCAKTNGTLRITDLTESGSKEIGVHFPNFIGGHLMTSEPVGSSSRSSSRAPEQSSTDKARGSCQGPAV